MNTDSSAAVLQEYLEEVLAPWNHFSFILVFCAGFNESRSLSTLPLCTDYSLFLEMFARLPVFCVHCALQQLCYCLQVGHWALNGGLSSRSQCWYSYVAQKKADLQSTLFEKKPSITYSLSDAPAKLSKAALELRGLILAVLLLSSPHPVYT